MRQETCTKCQRQKKLTEFHKRSDVKSGYRTVCKSCILEQVKEYSKTKYGKVVIRKAQKRYQKSKKGKDKYKRYCIHYPERQKARCAVNEAVRAGKLPHAKSLRCHYCPKQAKQYHHYLGYAPEHRLDVFPACRKCHNESHRLKKGA